MKLILAMLLAQQPLPIIKVCVMSYQVESFSVVADNTKAFSNVSTIEEARFKLEVAKTKYPGRDWRIRKTVKTVCYVD